MPRQRDQLSEHAVVRGLVSFLQGDGYRVRLEVPNMGQSTDVVAIRGRWVTFVEAKVAHWRRALQQCRAHEQVADFVCVAVASRNPSPQLLLAAEDSGYGVIHCHPGSLQCSWVLRPRVNRRVWTPQRRHWATVMRGVSHAH
jgi:hypothetical protein